MGKNDHDYRNLISYLNNKMMASMPPNVANELRLRKLISKEINIILAKTIATIQKNTTDPNLNLGVLLKGEFMDAINRMVDEKLNLHMQTIRLFDKKFNLIDNPTSSGSKADGKSGNGKIEAKDYSKHKVSELRITVLNDTFYIEGIPSNLKFEQLLLDGNVAYKFSLVNENEETENFNADELNKLLNNELNMSNISRSNSEDASNGTSNDIPSSSDSKSIGGNNNSGSESWQMTSMDRIIETPSDRKNRYLRGKCKCNCTSNCTVRKIRNKSNDSSKTVEMSENVSFDEPVETSNMMDETNATLEKESINDEYDISENEGQTENDDSWDFTHADLIKFGKFIKLYNELQLSEGDESQDSNTGIFNRKTECESTNNILNQTTSQTTIMFNNGTDPSLCQQRFEEAPMCSNQIICFANIQNEEKNTANSQDEVPKVVNAQKNTGTNSINKINDPLYKTIKSGESFKRINSLKLNCSTSELNAAQTSFLKDASNFFVKYFQTNCDLSESSIRNIINTYENENEVPHNLLYNYLLSKLNSLPQPDQTQQGNTSSCSMNSDAESGSSTNYEQMYFPMLSSIKSLVPTNSETPISANDTDKDLTTIIKNNVQMRKETHPLSTDLVVGKAKTNNQVKDLYLNQNRVQCIQKVQNDIGHNLYLNSSQTKCNRVQQRKSKRIEENKIHPKPVRDSPVRTINHVKTGRVGRPRKNQGIINPAETNTEQTPESADSRPMQRFKFVKRIPNLPNQHIIPVPDIQNLDKPIPAEAHDHEIPILDKTSLAVTKMIDFQSSLAICPTVSKLRNFNSLHMTTCLESQKCNLQALNESVDVSKRTGRLRKPRKPWPKKLRPTLTQIAELYSSTSTQADALTVAKQETLLKELRKMTSRGGTTTKKAFIMASKLADLNGIVL